MLIAARIVVVVEHESFDDWIPSDLRAMDMDGLVGRTFDEARSEVERAGGVFRAVAADERQGLPTAVTADFGANRITVVIKDGRVVECWGVG